MLRAIFLILISVSVLTSCTVLPQSFPQPPRVDVFQPLIGVQVCDGSICRILNECRQWRINNDGIFELVAILPLPSCSGTFAVTAEDYNRQRSYLREAQAWVNHNCQPPQLF